MVQVYHIRVTGHLESHWSAWFENMTISNQPNGEALLSGPLLDQAALHGVLIKIRDLGLPLLALTQHLGGSEAVGIARSDKRSQPRRRPRTRKRRNQ